MKGKELRSALTLKMEEESRQNPSVPSGIKLTQLLLAVWVLSRLFFLIMDLICARIGFTDSAPANTVAFFIALFLAILLYRGARKLAALPLIGGVMMLVNVFRQRMFFLLSLDLDPALHLHIISYILAVIVQILAMLLLLILPACKAYAEACTRALNACRTQQSPER